jgi:hypothetical protein
MLAAERYYSMGLCSSCNNASQCVYRKKRGFDAIYCETFDNLNGDGGRHRSSIVMDVVEESSEDSAKITYLGLCANCENRDNCQLPKPDAGVWHCEEYE